MFSLNLLQNVQLYSVKFYSETTLVIHFTLIYNGDYVHGNNILHGCLFRGFICMGWCLKNMNKQTLLLSLFAFSISYYW